MAGGGAQLAPPKPWTEHYYRPSPQSGPIWKLLKQPPSRSPGGRAAGPGPVPPGTSHPVTSEPREYMAAPLTEVVVSCGRPTGPRGKAGSLGSDGARQKVRVVAAGRADTSPVKGIRLTHVDQDWKSTYGTAPLSAEAQVDTGDKGRSEMSLETRTCGVASSCGSGQGTQGTLHPETKPEPTGPRQAGHAPKQ